MTSPKPNTSNPKPVSPSPSTSIQGIGYATSKALAVQKAHVHMVCRNKVRGEAALATLRAEVAELSGGVSDGANVSLHICDISSMAAVKALSDAYVLKGDPLHALINNAGKP